MAAADVRGSLFARPTSADWTVVGAYAGLIVVTYLLGVAGGLVAAGEVSVHPTVFRPILFPGLFVFAPPVVAALNRLRGGTVLGTLAAGLVPGVAFALLALFAALVGTAATPDSPLWMMVLVFSGIGVLGALAGIGAAHLATLLGGLAE